MRNSHSNFFNKNFFTSQKVLKKFNEIQIFQLKAQDPKIKITIAILIKVESESPNYIFPLHDFLGFRLNFFIALDYVPRMLSTNTLININIEHKRVYTADLLSSQRELMDVNFYVNKAIRKICCCYYCRLLLLLLLHIIIGNTKIVMYKWRFY